MKNENLKTGMILVTEDDEYVMVLKNTENGDIVSGDTWQPIYKDIEIIESLKVKKVYQPQNNKAYLSKNSDFINRNINTNKNKFYPCIALEDYKLIWERKEDKKEMTIYEIEKELGYPIKIVKED